MKAVRAEDTPCVVAVVVPVRVAAKATERNRLRRRVVPILNTLLPAICRYHIVITVQKKELPPPTELKAELLSILKKSDILSQ